MSDHKRKKPHIKLVTNKRGKKSYVVVDGCPKRDDIRPLMELIKRLNNALV